MSRALNKLTATEVAAAKGREKVYSMSDGGGLQFQVRPNGGKSWQFRYRNEKDKGAVTSFGTFPDVKLADARTLAEQARKDLSGPKRIRPKDRKRKEEKKLEEERRLHDNSFEFIAKDWYEYNCSLSGKNTQWTNDKHRHQILQTLETYAFPELGNLPVADIKVKDVRQSSPSAIVGQTDRFE